MTQAQQGLIHRLLRAGLLPADQAPSLAEQAYQEGRGVIACILEHKQVPAQSLAQQIALEFDIPLHDLDHFDLSTAPKGLISEALLRAHRVLPLGMRDRSLLLGVSDPTKLTAIDEIRFHTGLSIEPVLLADDQLERALEKWLDRASSLFAGMDDQRATQNTSSHQPLTDENASGDSQDDAPVVRFINKMLASAIRQGASDLHFEPYEYHYRIRFRIDGVLQDIAQPPVSFGPKLSARLKILSNLDISERRLPQDGRMQWPTDDANVVDFRVSTLPTLFGEKIVLRLLDSADTHLDFNTLGLSHEQQATFQKALAKPQGLILVTGPTGSGKTVSLYTGLKQLNAEGINISTAEDPVEIHLDGINQVSINSRIGLDFATALRAFLRQDPDVIMVGEIRDLETANIAIKAAQTGHLVLSTLHTNSAADALTRLLNMGVAAFNLVSTLQLIVAQRLVRRLCNHCKKPLTLSVQQQQTLGLNDAPKQAVQVFQAVGCNQCHQGYKGRLGLYEVVSFDAALAQYLATGADASQLQQAFTKAGIRSLRQIGFARVLEGLTSLEEVHRVTIDDV